MSEGAPSEARARRLEVIVKLPFSTGIGRERLSRLSNAEIRILEALADTVFPAGAGLPLSGSQAHVADYLEEMLERLPLREQVLLHALLWAFEAQAFVTRPRALARFSRLPPEEREASLRAWDESPFYFGRILFQALRGILLWAYVDNAEVGQAMGVESGEAVLRARRGSSSDGRAPARERREAEEQRG